MFNFNIYQIKNNLRKKIRLKTNVILYSFSNPICSQIIIPFLNSMISTNQGKGLEFKPTMKPLFPYSCSSVEFHLCKLI